MKINCSYPQHSHILVTGNKGCRLKGLEGLRLVDPKTFKTLRVLRWDTLFYNNDNMIYIPRISFNSTYTTFFKSSEGMKPKLLAYPLGTDSVIEVAGLPGSGQKIMADEHYIYDVNRDALSVYSLHTGNKLYEAVFATTLKDPFYAYNRCLYAQSGNGRLFRFDLETTTAYEEQVTATGIKTLRTFPVKMDENNRLRNDQAYEMAVAAGPSLVIVPQIRVDGNDPRNRGYVVDVSAGKISLLIAPFFNPDADQLANERKVDSLNKLFYAKEKINKEAACTKNLAGLGLAIGNTVSSAYGTGVIRKYDCAKDMYTLWIPKAKRLLSTVTTQDIPGLNFRSDWKKSVKQYHTCPKCNGSGTILGEVTKSRTKEVPQGYFSGIETKVTRTWTETVASSCQYCNGEGVTDY